MGEGESATTERPFHIMNAVERTSAKLRTWAASCRGCMPATPNMVIGRFFGACVCRVGVCRIRGGCVEVGLSRLWNSLL